MKISNELRASDEDAIEVAKLINVDYNNNPGSDAYYDLAGFQSDIGDHGDDMLGTNFSECQVLLDFLRSKGYDCGYGSIESLIAAGIAITKP